MCKGTISKPSVFPETYVKTIPNISTDLIKKVFLHLIRIFQKEEYPWVWYTHIIVFLQGDIYPRVALVIPRPRLIVWTTICWINLYFAWDGSSKEYLAYTPSPYFVLAKYPCIGMDKHSVDWSKLRLVKLHRQ
jgi:hypothetical protein